MKNELTFTSRWSAISIVVYILATILFPSCASWTVLDEETYKIIQPEAHRFQYKTSKGFTITRKLDEGTEWNVHNGKMKIIDREKVEQVFFAKGTKGVFMFDTVTVNKEKDLGIKIAIRLEDDESLWMMWGPNQKLFKHYTLMHHEFEKGGPQYVTYGGNEFDLDFNHIPKLKISNELLKELTIESRTAKGVRVQDSEKVKRRDY